MVGLGRWPRWPIRIPLPGHHPLDTRPPFRRARGGFERSRQGPAMVLAGISSLYTAALIAAWESESCTSSHPEPPHTPLFRYSSGPTELRAGRGRSLRARISRAAAMSNRDVDVFLPGWVRGRHRADSHVAFTCTSRIGADCGIRSDSVNRIRQSVVGDGKVP